MLQKGKTVIVEMPKSIFEVYDLMVEIAKYLKPKAEQDESSSFYSYLYALRATEQGRLLFHRATQIPMIYRKDNQDVKNIKTIFVNAWADKYIHQINDVFIPCKKSLGRVFLNNVEHGLFNQESRVTKISLRDLFENGKKNERNFLITQADPERFISVRQAMSEYLDLMSRPLDLGWLSVSGTFFAFSFYPIYFLVVWQAAINCELYSVGGTSRGWDFLTTCNGDNLSDIFYNETLKCVTGFCSHLRTFDPFYINEVCQNQDTRIYATFASGYSSGLLMTIVFCLLVNFAYSLFVDIGILFQLKNSPCKYPATIGFMLSFPLASTGVLAYLTWSLFKAATYLAISFVQHNAEEKGLTVNDMKPVKNISTINFFARTNHTHQENFDEEERLCHSMDSLMHA